MRAFSNANPKDVREAESMLSQAHSQGRSASIVGGGSDLLGMVKGASGCAGCAGESEGDSWAGSN
jgi:hypothetical protein